MLKTVSAIATQIISSITGGLVQFTGPAAGTTRVITVPNANATMARTDAAQSFTGDQTLGTGNLIQGTAAKGVNFTANTPAAGMTSQLFNWYEEGTWTPVDQSGAGLTITVDHAYYTRIGRIVTVNVEIFYPATANTNAAKISLPFTAAKYDIGTASANNGAVYSAITIGGSTACSFRNASLGTLTNANLSGANILFTFSYPV